MFSILIYWLGFFLSFEIWLGVGDVKRNVLDGKWWRPWKIVNLWTPWFLFKWFIILYKIRVERVSIIFWVNDIIIFIFFGLAQFFHYFRFIPTFPLWKNVVRFLPITDPTGGIAFGSNNKKTMGRGPFCKNKVVTEVSKGWITVGRVRAVRWSWWKTLIYLFTVIRENGHYYLKRRSCWI